MSKTKQLFEQADEDLWDRLEAEYMMQRNAYRYEDNPNPNDKPVKGNTTNDLTMLGKENNNVPR